MGHHCICLKQAGYVSIYILLKAFSELSKITAVHAVGFASVHDAAIDYFDNTIEHGGSVAYSKELIDINTTVNGVYLGLSCFYGNKGDGAIVHSTNELDAALEGGSQVHVARDVCPNDIKGGDGNDVIFGDTIKTDHLSWTDGNSHHHYASGNECRWA